MTDREKYIVAIECLKRIANYQSSEDLLEDSEDDWGVEGAEALEMAYENLQWEAENTLKRLGEDPKK